MKELWEELLCHISKAKKIKNGKIEFLNSNAPTVTSIVIMYSMGDYYNVYLATLNNLKRIVKTYENKDDIIYTIEDDKYNIYELKCKKSNNTIEINLPYSDIKFNL